MNEMKVEEFVSQPFDFVIVGGGLAGLTLAARLTEDPSVTVGVLEAGGDLSDMPEVNIPGMTGKAMGNDRIDWGFKSTPLPSCNNRPVSVPRGKGVGGSSALNFMVYSRASAPEYDAIEAFGNPGWNWSEFLKYMKKVESYTPPPSEIKERYHAGNNIDVHGTDGPLKISFSHWYNELHIPFLDSAMRLGVPVNIDTSNGVNMGASTGLFTIDPELATRSYAATAYYHPNAKRPNLFLLTHARAARVLFEAGKQDEQVANGVVFIKDGQEFTVQAKREVIIAAGTFQSPQVLELSGIGQRHVLEKHGITPLIDLPVGENLQDHSWVPFVHEVAKNIETYDCCADPDFLNAQVKLYQEQRRGMLSGSFSGYAYIPADRFMSPEVMQTFEAELAKDTSFAANRLQSEQFELLKTWFKDTEHPQLEILQFPTFYSLGDLQRKPDMSCRYQCLLLIDLHPFSRGSVHIASKDPLAAPAIDAGYLKSDRDVDMLVHSVRFARKLMETAPYGNSESALYDPPAEVIDDDAKLDAWVRNRVEGIYHPVGTCAMAPQANGGVVDSELRVYGTKNLRVIDASVIPLELSTHIQATVYSLAEKGADIIKATYA